MFLRILLITMIGATVPAAAQAPPADAAARFGARERIQQASLSPDGMSVAYVAPQGAIGSALWTVSLAQKDAAPVLALTATGDPERLGRCSWVSNKRLACVAYGVVKGVDLLPFSRWIAVDIGGGNVRKLARPTNTNSRGALLGDGDLVDLLPDGDDSVLMAREYLPDSRTGSRVGTSKEGLAVDRVNTATLEVTSIEPPRRDVISYISDGRGHVRIMEQRKTLSDTGLDTGIYEYMYRGPDERNWHALTSYNSNDRTGFIPVAIDPDKNVAYGFRRQDGRQALFTITLDGTAREELKFARPDVDVGSTVRIGRRARVVGVSYATDVNQVEFFDPALAVLQKSLGKAIPNQPMISIVDASVDEQRLLIWAGSDKDPGVYYVFDRKTRELATLDAVRPELEGQALATVKAVSYPAADGTMIPGYLTLPPGSSGKGLKAIVLPHGGPSARDYWGFDWLSQFFAGQGYAVLRPNFRGSSGYGDAWFAKNGFKSWRVAIGDVLDGGRWLAREGIAAPGKLGIVGWSYGGYAALQAAATDPGLFKAVVAIAPVTDLARLKEDSRGWSDFQTTSDFIGSGEHVKSGSPAQVADRIKAPVLMFHGLLDRNVAIAQSTLMDARLQAAGVPHELVTYPRLDHYLDDSTVRVAMLRKIDAFLGSSGVN